MRIQQPVKGFGALGEFGEIAFLQRFGECVEQTPDVTTLKGVMPWFAPLMQDGWDESVGTDTNIRGANDEVVSFDVGDLGFFVGGDALVLIMPFCQE